MIITKIEQAKKKERVNIFVDDEFYACVNTEIVYQSRLKKGMEVDSNYLDEVISQNENRLAYNQALSYISKAMKTVSQVKDYLTKKGYGNSAIDFAVSKLESYKYVDDEHYAELYVTYKKAKMGSRRIKEELRKRGIGADSIENGLMNISSQDEYEGAFEIAEKFMRNKENNIENLVKLNRKLLYNGFNYSTVERVINHFKIMIDK